MTKPATHGDTEPPRESAAQCLERVRGQARKMLAGEDSPYEMSHWMSGTAVGGSADRSPDGEHCSSLYLILAELQDEYDLGHREWDGANARILNFTEQWLEVSKDESRWRPFLDHWRYEKLGLSRPRPRWMRWLPERVGRLQAKISYARMWWHVNRRLK